VLEGLPIDGSGWLTMHQIRTDSDRDEPPANQAARTSRGRRVAVLRHLISPIDHLSKFTSMCFQAGGRRGGVEGAGGGGAAGGGAGEAGCAVIHLEFF